MQIPTVYLYYKKINFMQVLFKISTIYFKFYINDKLINMITPDDLLEVNTYWLYL